MLRTIIAYESVSYTKSENKSGISTNADALIENICTESDEKNRIRTKHVIVKPAGNSYLAIFNYWKKKIVSTASGSARRNGKGVWQF